MTFSEKPVVVVGAGIVGVCCAAYLLRAGRKVVLVDRRGVAEMTSFGNAGGIQNLAATPISMPGMLWKVPKWLRDPNGALHIRPSYLPRATPWLLRFLGEGRVVRVWRNAHALNALNSRCVETLMPLARWAGVDDLIRVPGQLYVFGSRESFESDRLANQIRASMGHACEVIDKATIRELEPDLAPVFEVGLRVPGNGHCRNPHRLAVAIAEKAAAEGLEMVGADVHGFERDGVAISGVVTDRGVIPAADVVVAAGMWSRTLAAELGHAVPLESHRGYHVTIPNPGNVPRNMLLAIDRKIAVTPMEGGLRVAGTVEFAGLEPPPTPGRAHSLLAQAAQILPGLDTSGHREWMGHRPCTPDSVPVIGRSPTVPNAWFAFGHGHMGLIGAAPTGALVAQLVTGQSPAIDPAPYRIDRF
ncbi:MAG: NAD(P)/FAD-dependent oxidoreductase [Alphaproteobacteria bacterium]